MKFWICLTIVLFAIMGIAGFLGLSWPKAIVICVVVVIAAVIVRELLTMAFSSIADDVIGGTNIREK